MRIIISGSREWEDPDLMRELIWQRMSAFEPFLDEIVLIHGNARGVDRAADEQAMRMGLKVERYPADWNRYGKAAGAIRNVQMVESGADLVIAFWNGRSKGTKQMIELAELRGIPVEVITDDGQPGDRAPA